jgi:hypothetical protein
MATTLEVLEQARAQLAEGEHRWAKGAFARDEWGEPAGLLDLEWTFCRCALGWVVGSYSPPPEAQSAARVLQACLPPGHSSVGLFNDDDATEYADVLALFNRAIAAERAASE